MLDRERGTIGGELEQGDVVVGERTPLEAADVQHSEDPPLHDERDAHQGADPLLAEDRIEYVGVVDVVDPDRTPLRRDPPGEPRSQRNPYPALHLLLDAARGARHERGGLAVEEQDGGGVRREDRGDPPQQLLEQVLEGEVGQRNVGELLQLPQMP